MTQVGRLEGYLFGFAAALSLCNALGHTSREATRSLGSRQCSVAGELWIRLAIANVCSML